MQFDWDEANPSHVARDGVSPAEAEEALVDQFRQILDSSVEGEEMRYKQIGSTIAGSLLIVWFTMREEACRPITAFDAPRQEARIYRYVGQ